MQIYSNLKNDETASVTLQLSAAEFRGIREYMHTPPEFSSVRLTNGIYINKRGFGWYRLSASNEYLTCRKFETALTLIRKIDRHLRGISEKEPVNAPRPLGVHFTRASQHLPKIVQMAPPARPLMAMLLSRIG